MRVDARLIREEQSRTNEIRILFDPRVMEFESSVTHDTLTLTANIGGCIGLILGVSFLQMFEILEKHFMFVYQKVPNPMK